MIRLVMTTLLVLVSACVSMAASETIPTAMNYQGKLTDSSGKPVSNGSYPVAFRLYKEQEGGEPLWTSSPLIVNTFGGVFNTLIGDIPDEVFDAGQLFLEVLIKDEPLLPRQPILSVGYAFRAQKAYDIQDRAVTSSKIALGAVNGSHLSMPLSVSSAQSTAPLVKAANTSTVKGIGLQGSAAGDGSDWFAAGVAGTHGATLRSPSQWNPDYKRAGVYGYSASSGTTPAASGHGVVGWSEYGFGGLFHSTNSTALAVDGKSTFSGDLELSGARTVNAPSGVTIKGPGNLNVVVGTSDITIRGDAANTYIKILADGTIELRAANNLNLSAGAQMNLAAPVVNIRGSAIVDVEGGLITLN